MSGAPSAGVYLGLYGADHSPPYSEEIKNWWSYASVPSYTSIACIQPLPIHYILHKYVIYIYIYICGPGSSVGIATDYGLDGPGSNPGENEIFRPSGPALGPTQPPVNGYRVFPGGKVRPGRAADHSLPASAAVMEE